MKTLENWTPRRGVSVPCITVLDPEANVLEADQRRLVRFLVQSGRGADILEHFEETALELEQCGLPAAPLVKTVHS